MLDFRWLIACYSVAVCITMLMVILPIYIFLLQGSRLVLVLHGRPNNAMGIYREGTELWVNPSRHTICSRL